MFSRAIRDVRIINVKSDADLNPGDRVTVVMELSQGFRALAIGYLFRSWCLLRHLCIITVAGAGELARHCSLCTALAVYYLIDLAPERKD